MKLKSLIPALIILIGFSCKPIGGEEPKPEISGCTEKNAVNYKSGATKDDGTCYYSKVVFYGAIAYYGGVPITAISVSVDGDLIGNLSLMYPNGPANCSVPGAAAYDCQSGRSIDWNATIGLANGVILVRSGRVTPSTLECIKVNVTR